MLLDIYTKDGIKSGQIEASDSVFGIDPNEHAMHLAVVATLANRRQGTHKTKIRSEVSGTGKKPWKQKGRGTARSGESRSPLWYHGGTVHGPKPHEYNQKLSKKLSRLAKKSALSLRVSENNLMVVEDFSFEKVRTQDMAQVLKNLSLDGTKTLLLMTGSDEKVYLSGRNIKKLNLQEWEKISTYDILCHKKIIVFKGAVEKFNNALNQ